MAAQEAEHGQLPITPTAKTGGGGNHYYFKQIPSLRNRTGFLPGLDIRAEGGYVLAPPSRHKSGNSYEWLPGKSILEIPLAEAPIWLVELIISKARATSSQTNGKVPEGGRHDSVIRYAVKLHHSGKSPEDLLEEVIAYNNEKCEPPLEPDEVERICNDVSEYERCFALTDSGNAERIEAYLSDELRYNVDIDKWLNWTSSHWNHCLDAIAREMVLPIMRNIPKQAADASDNIQKEFVSFAKKSESLQALKNCTELAKSKQRLRIRNNELNSDNWLFNVKNGTVNLKTGVFQKHCRDDLITNLANVFYDPDAKAPLWESVVNRCMNNNFELLRFLKQALGYSLTSETGEQACFIMVGKGANGKSLIADTIMKLLGSYAVSCPSQTLMSRKGDAGIPNDIARLDGARFILAQEGDENDNISEAILKRLTGEDKMTARYLYKEFFEFYNRGKIFLASNHLPKIRGTDEGIWRRIKLIPFEVTIPAAERDKHLSKKLEAEYSGILNWLISGLNDWVKNGLVEAAIMTTEIKQYIYESDPVRQFISEMCSEHSGGRISFQNLYCCYRDWCKENGHTPCGSRKLNDRLRDLGFKGLRNGAKGQHNWQNLSVDTINGLDCGITIYTNTG